MRRSQYRHWKTLSQIEQAIRGQIKDGPAYRDNVPLLIIEHVQGFEKFGHHECWGAGFKVKSMLPNGEIVEAEREHLDDAVTEWVRLYQQRLEEMPGYITGIQVPAIRPDPAKSPRRVGAGDLFMENPWDLSEIGRKGQDSFRGIIEA